MSKKKTKNDELSTKRNERSQGKCSSGDSTWILLIQGDTSQDTVPCQSSTAGFLPEASYKDTYLGQLQTIYTYQSVPLLTGKNPYVFGVDKHVRMRFKISFASVLTRVHHNFA